MQQSISERARSVGSVRSLEPDSPRQEAFDLLAGESPAAVRVREWLSGLASLRAPVLLLGEPGSGRRAAARWLHASGQMPGAPFHFIHAGATAPDAIPLRGTIHLHELEALPPEGQMRWRRFLEAPPEGARLIASADPLFLDRVSCGDFDAVLVQALQRFEVRLPALRERPEDVPGLAAGLLASIGRELGRPGRLLTGGALRRLARERWPGNLDELRRVVERLVAFSGEPRIGVSEVEAVLEDLRPSISELRIRHQLAERETLIRHLEETGGNVTETAEQMQRSRAAIYRLVEKYGIALRRGV